MSVNLIVPIIKKITPMTNNPTTRAKVLNIIMASSDGLLPKASPISDNLNSGDRTERKRGNPCRNIKTMHIQKIVFIFIIIIFKIIQLQIKLIN